MDNQSLNLPKLTSLSINQLIIIKKRKIKVSFKPAKLKKTMLNKIKRLIIFLENLIPK